MKTPKRMIRPSRLNFVDKDKYIDSLESFINELETFRDYQYQLIMETILDENVRNMRERDKYELALNEACKKLEELCCVEGVGQLGFYSNEWKEWFLERIQFEDE